MTTPTTTPIAEGLFAETAAGPRLLGSKCANCATPYFPKAAICHNPNCNDSKLEDAEFGPHGKIWSPRCADAPRQAPSEYDGPVGP